MTGDQRTLYTLPHHCGGADRCGGASSEGPHCCGGGGSAGGCSGGGKGVCGDGCCNGSGGGGGAGGGCRRKSGVDVVVVM